MVRECLGPATRAHCDEKKTWDLYAVCEVLMDKMDVVFLSQSLDLDNLGRRDVLLEQVRFDFFISPHQQPFVKYDVPAGLS